jgi:hypothetical protein
MNGYCANRVLELLHAENQRLWKEQKEAAERGAAEIPELTAEQAALINPDGSFRGGPITDNVGSAS